MITLLMCKMGMKSTDTFDKSSIAALHAVVLIALALLNART